MLSASLRARPGTAGYAMEVAREIFRIRFGDVAFPAELQAPVVGVVLLAGGYEQTVASLVRLAPLLGLHRAELVLANGGQDPDIGMLPAQIDNLRVICGETVGVACNLAVRALRSPVAMVLEAGVVVTDWGVPEADIAWIGAPGTASLSRWGLGLDHADRHLPWRIAVARSHWEACGGLDPEMEDGRGLEIADIGLRLRGIGVRLMGMTGDVDGPAPCFDRQGAGFRARWGHRAMPERHRAMPERL
jgi:hypothetical protein